MSKPTCRAVAPNTYSGGTAASGLEHAAGETLLKEMKLLRGKCRQTVQPQQRGAAACLACACGACAQFAGDFQQGSGASTPGDGG